MRIFIDLYDNAFNEAERMNDNNDDNDDNDDNDNDDDNNTSANADPNTEKHTIDAAYDDAQDAINAVNGDVQKSKNLFTRIKGFFRRKKRENYFDNIPDVIGKCQIYSDTEGNNFKKLQNHLCGMEQPEYYSIKNTIKEKIKILIQEIKNNNDIPKNNNALNIILFILINRYYHTDTKKGGKSRRRKRKTNKKKTRKAKKKTNKKKRKGNKKRKTRTRRRKH